jgi:hypothetical protein
VPSETVVVGALSLAFATGAAATLTALLILLATAGISAACGATAPPTPSDAAWVRRWAWMRRPRVRSALTWAGERLALRPAIPLLVARYIPVGRVAVNMTAGRRGCRIAVSCRSPRRGRRLGRPQRIDRLGRLGVARAFAPARRGRRGGALDRARVLIDLGSRLVRRLSQPVGGVLTSEAAANATLSAPGAAPSCDAV